MYFPPLGTICSFFPPKSLRKDWEMFLIGETRFSDGNGPEGPEHLALVVQLNAIHSEATTVRRWDSAACGVLCSAHSL